MNGSVAASELAEPSDAQNGPVGTKIGGHLWDAVSTDMLLSADEVMAVPPITSPYLSLRTGLCYDIRMRFHTPIDPTDDHPENPFRVLYIFKALVGANLLMDEEHGVEMTSWGM